MAQMRLRLFALLLASAAFSPATLSLAANPSSSSSAREPGSVHVVGFAAGDNFEQGEALSKAIKKALTLSTNMRPSSGDFSLEVLTAALGCPEKPDPSCLKKIATKISSQRFLWGTLAVEGQRISAELHLYAEDSGDRKYSFSYQAAQTDPEELPGVAAHAISQLMGPLRYRVLVHSSEQTGAVFVDGREAAQLVNGEAAVDVTAGDHRFRLKATRLGQERPLRVPVAELTKLRLEMASQEPAPASATPPSRNRDAAERTTDTQVEPLPPEVPNTSNPQRTWGYVTLGAGGVLLAGGVASAVGLYLLNEKATFKAYRAGLAPNQDACTEADAGHEVPGAMTPGGVRSLCNQASVLEVAQIALIAGGVVAAGTGLTLILTSKSNRPTATRIIEPEIVVGRHRTHLGVAIRF